MEKCYNSEKIIKGNASGLMKEELNEYRTQTSSIRM